MMSCILTIDISVLGCTGARALNIEKVGACKRMVWMALGANVHQLLTQFWNIVTFVHLGDV